MYLLWSDLKIKDKNCFNLNPKSKPVDNCCGTCITKAFIDKTLNPSKQDILYILSRMHAFTDKEYEFDRNISYKGHTVIGKSIYNSYFYLEDKKFYLPEDGSAFDDFQKFSKEFYEYFLEVHNQQ